MLRKLAAAGAAIGTLLVATLAQAQEKPGAFGEQGQFIFSANRLFGLFGYENVKSAQDNTNNQDTTVSATSISLFYGSSTTALGASAPAAAGVDTFYTVPRLGFDYTIIPNLTIGGDLIAFFALGGSSHTNPNTYSTDLPSGNVLGIAPRVGYIIGLNDIVSIWLRGGLHFYNMQVNEPNAPNQGQPPPNACSPGSFTAHVFGFDLDPQLVISPIPHFGFMVGPAFDWAPAGGYSVPTPVQGNCGQTQNGSVQLLHFGATAGLLGWF